MAKPEACPSCVPHTVLSSPHFPPLEPQRGLRLFPLEMQELHLVEACQSCGGGLGFLQAAGPLEAGGKVH